MIISKPIELHINNNCICFIKNPPVLGEINKKALIKHENVASEKPSIT